jgi:hypothetical protein
MTHFGQIAEAKKALGSFNVETMLYAIAQKLDDDATACNRKGDELGRLANMDRARAVLRAYGVAIKGDYQLQTDRNGK